MLAILLILLNGDPTYSNEILTQAKTENKHLLVGRDPVLLKWRSIREDKLWCLGSFEAELFYKNNKLFRKSRVEHVDNLSEFIKNGVVLVDFSASWCGPCRKLAPILEELNWAKIGKVDLDLRPDLKNQYDIQTIPTILVFKNGILQTYIVGLSTKQKLQDVIDTYSQ